MSHCYLSTPFLLILFLLCCVSGDRERIDNRVKCNVHFSFCLSCLFMYALCQSPTDNQTLAIRTRLVCGIEVLGKETQFFPMFGMQKERKQFPEEKENRVKLFLSILHENHRTRITLKNCLNNQSRK